MAADEPRLHIQDLVLTTRELQQLTGRRRADGMVAWLRAHGWIFEQPVLKGEVPRVARAYFDQRLVQGHAAPLQPQTRSRSPNFAVFGARSHGNAVTT